MSYEREYILLEIQDENCAWIYRKRVGKQIFAFRGDFAKSLQRARDVTVSLNLDTLILQSCTC